MEPLTMSLLASAGGSILGNVLGGIFGGDDAEKAREAQARALSEIESIGAAPDVAKQIYLKSFQQAGLLTPQVEQAINLEQDQKLKLQESDPSLKQEQKQSLNVLKQLAQTGLGLEDQVAARQLLKQSQQATTAKTNDILRQANERGQLGGGNVLAAQLAAVQSGDQATSEGMDRLAANASSARRSALQNLLSGQTQLRATDLDIDKTNLENERLRRQFLDQNSLARNQRNTAIANDASQFNVTRQQNVSDRNVGQDNAELQRQNEAQKWLYQQKLALAQSKANALTNQANNLKQDAANTQQSWSNIGQSVGSIGALAGSGAFSSSPASTAPSKLLTGKQYATMNDGGRVQGEPVVDEDHPINDNVEAKLSPGEIVIPRSYAKHPAAAKAFIENLFSKEKRKK